MSFHTIFFDLDGTLTDSAPGVLACVRYALDKLGVDPAGRDTAENFIGPPLMTSFTAQYAFDEAAARQAVAYYRERYSTVGLFENSVYPGVTNMLAALQQAGKQLVLATSKPEVFTLRILDHFDLRRYFVHVAAAALDGAQSALELSLSMAGILCLWSGVMEILNVCGLSRRIAALFRPLLRRLLPNASRDEETLAAVSANVSANLLGLGNAATPLGIQAARRMARNCGGTASDELCLLVVLNTASIQLLPTTVASVRAAFGSAGPPMNTR